MKFFICEECGCENETRRQIEEHMESNHQPRQNYANHKCDLCSYVAIHHKDLNRHMRTMHESFQIPRTFFSTRNQRNFQQDNEARQEPRRTQFKSGLPNSSAGNFGNLSTTSKYPHSTDQLPFPCTKCDDSFKHRDELDLHMEFFHTAMQRLARALVTYNIEGYKRNKFYLTTLLKKYDILFLFLQEHWLSHHEAHQTLKRDFPKLNFVTTSSDMFIDAEDLALRSGPTWHGAAIECYISKLPIVSDRFCGVLYHNDITDISLLSYSVYLPTSGQDEYFLEVIDALHKDITCHFKEKFAIIIGADTNQSLKSTPRRTEAMK